MNTFEEAVRSQGFNKFVDEWHSNLVLIFILHASSWLWFMAFFWVDGKDPQTIITMEFGSAFDGMHFSLQMNFN